MPTMSSTVPAYDINSATIWVRHPLYILAYIVIERRPSASALKLIWRLVQRSIALPAQVAPLPLVVQVLASPRILSPLKEYDACLIHGQLIISLHHLLRCCLLFTFLALAVSSGKRGSLSSGAEMPGCGESCRTEGLLLLLMFEAERVSKRSWWG